MDKIKEHNQRKKGRCLYCDSKYTPYNGLCPDCYIEISSTIVVIKKEDSDRKTKIRDLIMGLLGMST